MYLKPDFSLTKEVAKMITDSKTDARKKSPKRAAIIEAATEEFLLRGFSGTSMDQIAKVANVSKRTVYDHFPSKDNLFQAIVDEILQQIGEMPSHEYSKEKPLDEQLLAIGKTFATTITGRDFMKLSRVVISRFIQAPEWAHNTLNAHARLRQDMIAFFKAGKKDGRLKIGNPEKAAAQFCGLIKEIAFWPELMAGQEPISTRERNATVKAAVEIFLDHYLISEQKRDKFS
ncbi:MAG: TetR/AcrR family transcriptional regulator [Symploca sp. SIO2D2]|nr:TetR/AcrR family transcriptional regulator [Symploca sp. SIO2D2]